MRDASAPAGAFLHHPQWRKGETDFRARGVDSAGGPWYRGTAMTTESPLTERVQTGWRVRRDLKRRLDIEAAKRQLRPAHVVEELIEAMLEKTDDAT